MSGNRAAMVEGVRDMTPILLGVAPFGLVAGATAVDAGFPPVLAAALSVLVFAGASQLAVIDLVGKGAPAGVIVVTAVVVNLRYLMYSASFAPYIRSFARRWRVPLTYLLTDQAFALTVTRFEADTGIAGRTDDPETRQWYYFGAAAVIWVTFQVTTVVGILVGARVPPAWSLEFAVPLTFLALVVPNVEDSASAVAAGVAGTVAVLGIGLPLNLGLTVGALSGVVAGLLVDRGDADPDGDPA